MSDVDGDMPTEERVERLQGLAMRLYRALLDVGHDPGLHLEEMACLIGSDVKTAAKYAKAAGLPVPDEYDEST